MQISTQSIVDNLTFSNITEEDKQKFNLEYLRLHCQKLSYVEDFNNHFASEEDVLLAKEEIANTILNAYKKNEDNGKQSYEFGNLEKGELYLKRPEFSTQEDEEDFYFINYSVEKLDSNEDNVYYVITKEYTGFEDDAHLFAEIEDDDDEFEFHNEDGEETIIYKYVCLVTLNKKSINI